METKRTGARRRTSSAAPAPGPERGYHHGNLRRALLDAALALFAERGTFDFTFRELARAADVTHNAPYRHFQGKDELLQALRAEGLARLAELEHEALLTAGDDPRARVAALGEAYVRFAVGEPAVFRLVLAHPFSEAGPEARGAESYTLLERAIEEGRQKGAVRTDLSARELALAAWSLVHGIASLLVSGHVPAGPKRIKGYVALLSTVFFDGASAPAARATR
jgi:AcrR family transcriptional regulator